MAAGVDAGLSDTHTCCCSSIHSTLLSLLLVFLSLAVVPLAQLTVDIIAYGMIESSQPV